MKEDPGQWWEGLQVDRRGGDLSGQHNGGGAEAEAGTASLNGVKTQGEF